MRRRKVWKDTEDSMSYDSGSDYGTDSYSSDNSYSPDDSYSSSDSYSGSSYDDSDDWSVPRRRGRSNGWGSFKRLPGDSPTRRGTRGINIGNVPRIVWIILAIVVAFVLLYIFVFSNDKLMSQLNSGLENIVQIALIFAVYVGLLWAEFLFTIGRRTSRDIKILALVIIAIAVFLSYFISALRAVLIFAAVVVGVIYFLLKK